MKIVIDLTSLADNFSGFERYALSITQELVLHQENQYILIFKNNIHSAFDNSKKDNVKTVVLNGSSKLLFNQFILPSYLYKIKADWYLFLAFPVPILFFAKNVVSTIHDICCWDYPETMKWFSAIYFRVSYRVAVLKCKKIITVSQFSKRRIIDKLSCSEKNIWVICNGISDVFLCENYNRLNLHKKYHLPEKYILSLSTLEPRKNLKLLIATYIELKTENLIDVHLVLAGRKGWKISHLLDSLDSEILKFIHVTGFVDDADLPDLYHNAKLFVFPSMYEGFGIPPLEAMACRTPVVSSDATALPEVLRDAAVYFKSNDKESLKGAMLDVLQMTGDEQADMLQKAHQLAKSYSWDCEAKKLCHLLKIQEGEIKR